MLGLSKYAIAKLANEADALGGIGFRFGYEDSVGLVKVIPSAGHEIATAISRGTLMKNFEWAWAYQPTSGPQPRPIKQPPAPGRNNPTSAYFPGPTANPTNGWPTFVLETGVSELLPHLRQDASWWFANSRRQTRIVLVILVKKKKKFGRNIRRKVAAGQALVTHNVGLCLTRSKSEYGPR